MVCIDKCGSCRIPPFFGIQMDTNDHVWLKLFIYQFTSAANFGDAVKEPLTLPANRTLAARVGWSHEIFPDISHSLFFQKFQRCGSQIGGANIRGRLRARADEIDLRTQGAQFRCKQLRHSKSKISFGHWRTISQLEPSFFHTGPGSAEMTRVDR